MLFKYKVKFLDDYENGSKIEQGLIVAKGFTDACRKAIQLYNEDTIIDITLEHWEDIVTFYEILEGLKL